MIRLTLPSGVILEFDGVEQVPDHVWDEMRKFSPKAPVIAHEWGPTGPRTDLNPTYVLSRTPLASMGVNYHKVLTSALSALDAPLHTTPYESAATVPASPREVPFIRLKPPSPVQILWGWFLAFGHWFNASTLLQKMLLAMGGLIAGHVLGTLAMLYGPCRVLGTLLLLFGITVIAAPTVAWWRRR